MNKKIILGLCLVVAVMSIGTVCAESMVSHDFDDFKMDVPKDSNFQKVPLNNTDDADILNMNEKAYLDEGNMIIVESVDTSLISKNQISLFTHYVFNLVNPDLNQAYEHQDGNLRVMEPASNSDQYFSVVCINSGNKSVVLAGLDVNTLKDMANTIDFN